MLPSSFHFDEASRFDATGRLHFISARPAASSFSCPACGFAEEKRQPPSRRSGALARREGGRAGALQDAARGSEAIGKRASVLDCPPSAVLLRRTGGGPPPLSIQGAANRFSPDRFRGRGRSGFGLLNLMGCSPHSFLRVQKIQFPVWINVKIEIHGHKRIEP